MHSIVGASTLVYVNDTKPKQKGKTEEDVEMMQVELQNYTSGGRKIIWSSIVLNSK